jgi:cytochrome c551/c552
MKNIVLLIFLALHVEANDMSSLMFNGNCITCHKETKTVSAPSVLEFKAVYMGILPNREDFIDYMSKWVQNPDKETAMMPKAVKKHGLMPHLGFDIETLRDISAYIYDTDFKTRGGKYWRSE